MIEWWDFPPPLEAIYWSRPDLPPIIGLSYTLQEGAEAYARCILAEEMGHYFTTAYNPLPHVFFTSKDIREINRLEWQARKWAALYLIPEDRLRAALKHGAPPKTELAALFRVTEKMLAFRLELYLSGVTNIPTSASGR